LFKIPDANLTAQKNYSFKYPTTTNPNMRTNKNPKTATLVLLTTGLAACSQQTITSRFVETITPLDSPYNQTTGSDQPYVLLDIDGDYRPDMFMLAEQGVYLKLSTKEEWERISSPFSKDERGLNIGLLGSNIFVQTTTNQRIYNIPNSAFLQNP
jgi:hypothetical protein